MAMFLDLFSVTRTLYSRPEQGLTTKTNGKKSRHGKPRSEPKSDHRFSLPLGK